MQTQEYLKKYGIFKILYFSTKQFVAILTTRRLVIRILALFSFFLNKFCNEGFSRVAYLQIFKIQSIILYP